MLSLRGEIGRTLAYTLREFCNSESDEEGCGHPGEVIAFHAQVFLDAHELSDTSVLGDSRWRQSAVTHIGILQRSQQVDVAYGD